MRVGVFNVQNLTSSRHVASYTLICWNAKLFLYKRHQNPLLLVLCTEVELYNAFIIITT